MGGWEFKSLTLYLYLHASRTDIKLFTYQYKATFMFKTRTTMSFQTTFYKLPLDEHTRLATLHLFQIDLATVMGDSFSSALAPFYPRLRTACH